MSDNIDIAEFEQRVRLRAYWLWEAEGRPVGRHVEHWLLSEAAERAECAAAPAEAAVVAFTEAPAAAPEAAPAAISVIETPKAKVAAAKKSAAKAKTARASKKTIAAANRSAPAHEISAGL